MLVTLSEAIAMARSGSAIAFPTDTVPALAVKPDCADKIYRLKGRSPDKPLILMGDSIDSLRSYVMGWHSAWQEVAKRSWPGQLTLVLPASEAVPASMISGGSSVGLRIPASSIACSILASTGPLATTSANRSGSPPLTTAAAINAAFPTIAVLDYPFPPAGTPSTVARWCEQDQTWEILRQGSYVLPPLSRRD
ncbi:MAG: L-threonylcarbamoyladenylate synthase [Synechococcus sp.]